MDSTISREEHEEFRKRIDETDKRQDRRISELEDSVKEITALTTSIERLAVSMENMAKEQSRQGKRLEVLENRDGEMWRKVVGYAVTAVLGIVIGFAFTRLGM